MERGRLDEAARSIETTRECWTEPEMHRLRAQLLLSINKYTAAEVSYRHALSLAHPWKDQGKCAEARDLLAQIYGCFNEGFDAPVLQQTEVLLHQLAFPRKPNEKR